MLRSMFSGVSGLRSHQTMMDVVGNNIANVNTSGFKSSNVVFADTLSQLTKAAGAPTEVNGGTNPSQVGLGVRVDAITQNMTQGSAQSTGKSTDLMLSGDGMFAVQQGDGVFYTRNGSFTLDAQGSVVTNSGAYVMGWRPDDQGNINTNGTVDRLVIPSDSVMAAKVTSEAAISGNLDNTPNVDGTAREVTSSFKAYDEQGNLTTVYLRFTNADADAVTAGHQKGNSWNVAWDTSPNGTFANALAPINFDGTPPVADGAAATPDTLTIAAGVPGTPAASPTGAPIAINLEKLTGYVGATGKSNVEGNGNGFPIGTLTSYSFGTDGVITGSYSNGYKQTLGQVAIARFNNSAGLVKEGGSLYSVSTNSGDPVYGIAGEAGRGAILAGSLEMSNVDLSAEFTNLILAQRGFQANSRIISASDEILQDLVNLKR
ncbi:flagellar hook protein FlgE [Kineococcus esterisolvens]|uniref:flagellar hook protein FlgE n=1 Tax=unclassified Kineococcus TaxID=2621656 RepID=UPI003D7E4E33